MRLVTFLSGNSTYLGALLGQQIVELQGAYRLWLHTSGTSQPKPVPRAYWHFCRLMLPPDPLLLKFWLLPPMSVIVLR
jgi:hypothetical protein